VIVIDTNVVSEMMRDEPDQTVSEWADAVRPLYTAAVTLAELDYGIARLTDGRRRDRLAATAAAVFADFGDVILTFDARAARYYGRIVADRERAGRPITTATRRSPQFVPPRRRPWPPATRTTSTGQASVSSIPGTDPVEDGHAERAGAESRCGTLGVPTML
jgi:predicted nucleic acid-binding protein